MSTSERTYEPGEREWLEGLLPYDRDVHEIPPSEDDDDDEACISCEDTGWIVTPAGWKIPCSDCPTGELNFYHEREKTIAEMVHVDELLPGIDPEYDGEK